MRFLVLFLLGLTLTAQAQSTWPRQVLFQNQTKTQIIEARTPSNDILFTFGRDYPPAVFPARYVATTPRDGLLPFQVRSNVQGPWSLTLEISDLRDGSGRLLVPARQIMYRVQNGPWLRGNGTPQILYSANGPTREWQELRLEFQIELLGNETAGLYAVQAYFGAVTQP
jgi:hypothetical protein